MKTELIAITQPIESATGCKTAEEFIAYVARVSNPANQNNTETATKLLKYLAKNQHFSPFEMVSLTVSINTTRDIGRQILRHRSFSFQEFSQRYAKVCNFTTEREARLQDTKNRQNSIETDNDFLQLEWSKMQEEIADIAKSRYLWALDNGIAKEVARSILPEGLTETQMYMAGTLRSFIHYCALRCGNETQKEHKEIALDIRDNILLKQFPSLEEILLQPTEH